MLALVSLTAAAATGKAIASRSATSGHPAKAAHARSPEAWLRVKLRAAHKYRSTIRYFEKHRRLADVEGAPGRGAGGAPARTPQARDGRRERSPTTGAWFAPARPSGGRALSPRRLRGPRSAGCSVASSAGRRSPWPGASPVSTPPPRTGSTSASSRWGRANVACSATVTPHTSRPSRRIATSCARAATGARGAAGSRLVAADVFVAKSEPGPHSRVSFHPSFW